MAFGFPAFGKMPVLCCGTPFALITRLSGPISIDVQFLIVGATQSDDQLQLTVRLGCLAESLSGLWATVTAWWRTIPFRLCPYGLIGYQTDDEEGDCANRHAVF